MIKKIATQAVYVEDQKRALDFWVNKMGFEKRNELDMGNGYTWLEVAPFGAETCLVLYPKSLMNNWSELSPSIVFLSENLNEYYEELIKKGVSFKGKPQKMPWGKFAFFKDEDGNDFMIRE